MTKRNAELERGRGEGLSRERERDRQTDRQTDRQRDRQRDRQTNRQTDRNYLPPKTTTSHKVSISEVGRLVMCTLATFPGIRVSGTTV